MSHRIYAQLAALLSYPEKGYHDKVRAALASQPSSSPPALFEFGAAALAMSLEELQERFTSAFDLNPKGTLDLGWHLFGEKYERGLLLVRMRQQLAKYAIAESSELPDHLTHALLLLDAMLSECEECAGQPRTEADAGADFAGAIVLPALAAILSAAQENAPYDLLLKAVDSFLREEFPSIAAESAQVSLPIIDSSPRDAALVSAGSAGDME